MKALIVYEHGPVESLALGEFADPKPGKGEVLVHVHAASINFPDRKSTRLNSSHVKRSRMPSSA